jgi:hypothetical protein
VVHRLDRLQAVQRIADVLDNYNANANLEEANQVSKFVN